MKNYRNLCAQAVACAVLTSSVIGADGPLVLLAPLAGDEAVIPRSPVRKPIPMPMPMSPSSKIPDRPWIYDGTRVVTCDIEADPGLGGRMTEIALVEMQYGEYTGKSLHYFFNPNGKVDYRFVKKVDPIDQSKQPTFEQVSTELYDFISGATLITYGAFDIRKLCEHFGIVKPYGQVFTFEWRDAHQMERRDYARQQGQDIASPAPKKTQVVSRSPSDRKKEYAAKRKASRDQKEIADLKKFIASQEAHKKGLPSPKRKRPESVFDGVSFKQGDVAQRKGITASTGIASVGGDAEQLNQLHGIPMQHVDEAHHAMHDTQVLTGIVATLGQPTLKRQILKERPKVARRPARGDESPTRRRLGKENHSDNRNREDAERTAFAKSKKRSFKLDFDTSGEIDGDDDL